MARANSGAITMLIAAAAVAQAVALLMTVLLEGWQSTAGTGTLWLLSPVGSFGMLFAYIGAGAIIGSVLRAPWSPALIGVAAFGLPLFWLPLGLHKIDILSGGASLDSVDFTYVPRTEVMSAQALLGIALAALAIGIWTPTVMRRVAIVGPVLVCAIGSFMFLQSTADTRFWMDDSPLQVRCFKVDPRICAPMDIRSSAQGLRIYVARLNHEALRLGLQSAHVSQLDFVSYGQLQRRSANASRWHRWLTVDEDIRSGSSELYFAGHIEQLVYPASCFGPQGLPGSAWNSTALRFRLYLGYVALARPYVDDISLQAIERLPNLRRDAWLRAAWTEVLHCSPVQPV